MPRDLCAFACLPLVGFKEMRALREEARPCLHPTAALSAVRFARAPNFRVRAGVSWTARGRFAHALSTTCVGMVGEWCLRAV